MSKKSKQSKIDTGKLEEEYEQQKGSQYEKRPIFRPRPPEGTAKFAYRMIITGDFRKLTSKRGIVWNCIDVTVVETVNDNDVKAGIATMLCHDVLKKSLEKIGSIKNQTFDVMNMGKPEGKQYYDFVVRKAEGTLRLD